MSFFFFLFFFFFLVFFFFLGEKGFFVGRVFSFSLSIYKCIHTHARERETNNATVVDCDDEAVGRERERDERDERTAVEVVSFFCCCC